MGQISWDYQRSLYWSGVAAGSPEYDRLKSEVHQRGADRLLQLCCANRGCFIKGETSSISAGEGKPTSEFVAASQ